MPIETNLEDQLNKFKEQYYQENKKKTFFKNSQKKDCAEKVVQHFSIEQLLQNSIYVKDGTIFIDYPIIKTFIQPNNYYLVMDYIDKVHDYMFTNNKTINIVIDMKSFTITAAQRYMELIKQFCNKYLQNDNYMNRIQTIYVRNSPSVIDVLRNMVSPFVSSNVSEKVVFLKTN